MRRSWWRVYVGAAVFAVLVFQFLPDSVWVSAAGQAGIGYLAFGALVAGTLRLPRSKRPVWWLIAVAVGANATGFLFRAYIITGTDLDPYGPTFVDVFFLALYPCVALAFVLNIRRSPPPLFGSAVLDSATISTGVILLAWVYAISPAINDTSATVTARAVQVAYLLGDIVLLGLALVLIRGGPDRRRGSAPWSLAAVLVFLLADLLWLVDGTLDLGWENTLALRRGMDSVLLTTFLLFGYAVSRAGEDDRTAAADGTEDTDAVRGGVLLLPLALGGALLIAPAVLVDQIGDADPDTAEIAFCSAVMAVLVVARMARLLSTSERQALRVRELSRRDELTGLPNRRAWNATLSRELAAARAYARPVSVAMLDLDHFKNYNDWHGHPAGDRLLKEAAAAWQSALRGTDLLARYGGEEFILLLPGADLDQARIVVDRARGRTPSGQSFSAGVACWDFAETGADLIARADVALYAAKAAGRARTEVAVLQ